MNGSTTAADIPNINLRDIHVPESVAWWPLAPGWWLLLAVMLLVVCVLVWLRWRRYRVVSLQTLARQHFDTVIAVTPADSSTRFTELVLLLRRITRALPGGEVYARDTEGEWFDWLSLQAGLPGCPPALQQQVVRLPYQPPHPVDSRELTQHCAAIIRGLPARSLSPRSGLGGGGQT